MAVAAGGIVGEWTTEVPGAGSAKAAVGETVGDVGAAAVGGVSGIGGKPRCS